jgi:hypothetical protein
VALEPGRGTRALFRIIGSPIWPLCGASAGQAPSIFRERRVAVGIARTAPKLPRWGLVLNRFAVDWEGDAPFGRAIANMQRFAYAETEFTGHSRSIESP